MAINTRPTIVWLSGPEGYGEIDLKKDIDEIDAHRDEIEMRTKEMMNDIIKMKPTNQPKE